MLADPSQRKLDHTRARDKRGYRKTAPHTAGDMGGFLEIGN
jgi:hypothetical protein